MIAAVTDRGFKGRWRELAADDKATKEYCLEARKHGHAVRLLAMTLIQCINLGTAFCQILCFPLKIANGYFIEYKHDI